MNGEDGSMDEGVDTYDLPPDQKFNGKNRANIKNHLK
jgi:hypothetical protein